MNEELKVIISAEVTKLKKGVEDAEKQIKGFKEHVKDAGKDVDANFARMGGAIESAMKIGAAAAVVAGVAIYEFASKTAETADNIDKMSQRLGLSRQAYQELDYVLSQSGSNIDSFGMGVKSLLANMDSANEGNATAAANFAALGVSVSDASGALRSQEEVLQDVIVAFQAMENGSEKNRLATELFGRAGQDIIPLLNAEAGRFEELTAKANELGLIMSDDAVNAGVEFTDTLDTLQRSIGAVGNEIGAELMPYVTDAMQYIIDHMPEIKSTIEEAGQAVKDAIGWAQEHQGVLLAIGATIGVIVAAITMYNIVAGIKTAMAAAEVASVGALAAAYAAQAVAMGIALLPYIAITAAIVVLIAVIVLCVKHWDEIKAKVQEVAEGIKEAVMLMVEDVKEKFEAIKQAISDKVQAAKDKAEHTFEALKIAIQTKIEQAHNLVRGVVDKIKDVLSFNGLSNAVSNVFNSIKTAISDKLNAARDIVKSAIDKIKGFFNFSWSLPHLKMPHISITGSFSLMPPSVPNFGISWYAKGGVFDNPTLFNSGRGLAGIGEAGAEAVVPLENNTEWLDRIAERLSGGGRDIVLQIDGREFARASVDSINGLTKQTGRLALQVV